MALDLLSSVVILIAAIGPPVIYLIWVRDLETCQREPYAAVFAVFLFGASFSVGGAYILESLSIQVLYSSGSPLAKGFWNFQPFDPTLEMFILAVILAPVIEETLKGLGVFTVYGHLRELEDGLVYGAAAGLGFAASENILYLANALAAGTDVFVLTVIVRSFTSVFLHASATGITGFGIARGRLHSAYGMGRRSWLPYLLVAMVLHASFNLFAILGDIFPDATGEIALLGLLLAFMLAAGAFSYIRRRIKELDRMYPCPPSGPLPPPGPPMPPSGTY
ncbi:MAG TPA: PrsW family intramembrane metalloprotease [Methanomassiliicoccales archaeon]|nr:PrsW family intramembrane metalloprotease [Methanomassiliicoccales archaeon]